MVSLLLCVVLGRLVHVVGITSVQDLSLHLDLWFVFIPRRRNLYCEDM